MSEGEDMEARYLTNERGERIGVVMDMETYHVLQEAQRVYEEGIEVFESNRRRIREELEHLQEEEGPRREALEFHLATLDEILEDVEDHEATEAFDRDMAEIERGEAELIPWEQSKARRRGEL